MAQSPGSSEMTRPAWHSRIIVVLATACAVLALDRITKHLAWHNLRPIDNVSVIPGLFDLTYVENPGIAFGMFQEHPEIFTWLSILCVILVSWYIVSEVRRSGRVRSLALVGWGGIVGGAMGNVWDRLYHNGRVIDFLDFYIGEHHWPSFNIADSAICVGVALIVLFLSQPEKKNSGAAEAVPPGESKES